MPYTGGTRATCATRAWQARHVLSKRGLRPEAFISPGDSSEETVVFICAASRLHVRSAAALPPVSEASMAAPAWEATRQRAAHPLPHPCAAVSASHAAVITLLHRLQVLRAVAHVAPWWLYPLCMLALLIPACASAGVHGGRMLAARSPCPCPYPCPYPWPCPRPCPSSRTQGAPSWLLFSHGALLARQASAYSGRSVQPARGPGPARRLAPGPTPHATRHARRRPARRHLQAGGAQPHLALWRGGHVQTSHQGGQEALPVGVARPMPQHSFFRRLDVKRSCP